MLLVLFTLVQLLFGQSLVLRLVGLTNLLADVGVGEEAHHVHLEDSVIHFLPKRVLRFNVI